MAETNIKTLRDLIFHNREVKSLTEKSRRTNEMQRALLSTLPSMLADYCQVQSYERGVLTLNATTGSAATQLRFLAPQMMSKLRKSSAFKDLEQVQVKIHTPETVGRPHQVRSVPPTSSENCQLINDTADSLSDPGLADSLRRLAATLGKNGKD